MLRELDEAARALAAPRVVLFDWHATLVDTLDAMYHAVDDVLPQFPDLGLMDALITHEQCKTPEDARLVDYVREHQALHPKIKAQRRISRTDIFEVLFGHNEDAKQVAHEAFNNAYRNHYGEVQPFEGGELDLLKEMRELDVRLGILTNRDREFFELELRLVDDGAWVGLFEGIVCGCDTGKRKPNPEPIFKALDDLGVPPGLNCWYVGDSTTDVIAAKRAGVTSVFFNGVGWDHSWINKIFPGTAAHPHQPDAIVDSFAEFRWLVEECLEVGHDWHGTGEHQAVGCSEAPETFADAEPLGIGPYSVGSTNMEVAPEYAGIGDDAMHEVLLGRAAESGQPRFIADILKYPESAWVTEVLVPDDNALYGPASGMTLPVVTFVTFPSSVKDQQRSYSFPYHDARYGSFEDMLAPGEEPGFADPQERYPLIILAHGADANGVYDVRHAHNLASHGYIVAVITYGDDRTAQLDQPNFHVSYLRPLLTKAVLDSLLDSETFGPHIDADNIGITGHSFGGFTALALAGGPFQGNTSTVSDGRIKAGVIAAPWVGGKYDGNDVFAFSPNNTGLNQVNIPMICFFGTKDEVTLASFILPAMRELSGPTYVVELVDQPHIFEQGSWEDRDNWELLFFSAYLKHDPASLTMLKTAPSMQGGNEDVQLFDYQQSGGSD